MHPFGTNRKHSGRLLETLAPYRRGTPTATPEDPLTSFAAPLISIPPAAPLTSTPAATIPLPHPLHAVDPSNDFLSRAAGAGVQVSSPLTVGALVVDLDSYAVSRAGVELVLSPRQVELLALFLSGPRKVWSREQLHWVCWGDRSRSRRVDVQLCRLRAKTGLDLFRNVRDRGWALRSVA